MTAYNATGYNRVADLLQVRDGSLLTPDVGGTLLFSRLRVYDLAMLCDRTIAMTMGRRQQAFYDYVFGEVRPTFIVSGGVWVERAALERDPRFVRDYVSIRPLVGAVITARDPTGAFDYVRREVLTARLSGLAPERANTLKMELRDILNGMNNDF